MVKGGYATYWYYLIRLDTDFLGVDAPTFGAALNAEGIAGSGRFYMRPVHLDYPYLSKKTAFHHSRYPFTLARKSITYAKGSCPEAERAAEEVYYFPLNEWLASREIDDTIAAVKKVAAHYREQKRRGA